MRVAGYPWPGQYRSATLISIDVDAESPLLWRLRNEPDKRYLAEHEQRQHGVRRGLAGILDVLHQHEVRATFFVPGLVAELHPELVPMFVARGHEVGLHGYAHEAVRDVTDAEFTATLARSMDILTKQAGHAPRGFRSPGWEMTKHMLGELASRELYDSSLAGNDVPYTVAGVAEIPVSWNREDTVRFKLTGVGDRISPSSPVAVLDEWLFDWQATSERGGLFTLTLHDWIAGRPAQLRMLDRLLSVVRQDQTCWVATAWDIAENHRGMTDRKEHG